MPRISPVDPTNADPAAKPMLENVKKSLGMVPNMMATLAHSPAALEAYLGLGQALGKGKLGGKLSEQIAMTLAGERLWLLRAAHTVLGGMQGVEKDELGRNLDAQASDPKTQAALEFARTLAVKRGWATDAEFKAVKDAGFTDGQIAEIIAHVALNTFTNYFNHVAETEIDFPKVEVGEPAFA